MSPPQVGIVDYRMGNLRSVEWALERLGARPRWVHGPADLEGLDAVVLPGVGAFPKAMEELARMGLTGHLQRWIEHERPFLGVCLGFQLLFESSDEGAGAAGLGALPGTVTRLPAADREGGRLKVPHMGWNTVEAAATGPLADFGDHWFYFVHSFAAPERVETDHLVSDYGRPFVSAVARDRLWGAQFHPERSGREGLRLLERFLAVVA